MEVLSTMFYICRKLQILRFYLSSCCISPEQSRSRALNEAWIGKTDNDLAQCYSSIFISECIHPDCYIPMQDALDSLRLLFFGEICHLYLFCLFTFVTAVFPLIQLPKHHRWRWWRVNTQFGTISMTLFLIKTVQHSLVTVNRLIV